jgi:hypothetical protein
MEGTWQRSFQVVCGTPRIRKLDSKGFKLRIEIPHYFLCRDRETFVCTSGQGEQNRQEKLIELERKSGRIQYLSV